jgi:hypothetical protein
LQFYFSSRLCCASSQIHDFNYRWRTRWAQWALPPNEASSSKAKSKPARPTAAYRVDDDEYDNESFEDENQQQEHDNHDDEDETSTGARFNAHRIGATMQLMHTQMAPIQVRLVVFRRNVFCFHSLDIQRCTRARIFCCTIANLAGHLVAC